MTRDGDTHKSGDVRQVAWRYAVDKEDIRDKIRKDMERLTDEELRAEAIRLALLLEEKAKQKQK